MSKPRILVTFGTRPEAIKMFPVVHALRASGSFDARVAVTAQHREMLDQVLNIADITPDIDLDLMQAGQSLDELASRIILHFGDALDKERPDRVLVHGDTLTTMMVSNIFGAMVYTVLEDTGLSAPAWALSMRFSRAMKLWRI